MAWKGLQEYLRSRRALARARRLSHGYSRRRAGVRDGSSGGRAGHPGDPRCRGHVDKAIDLLGEAADGGASLAVFPECFVSLYPTGTWAAQAATWVEGAGELWERMWTSSVDVGGPLVDRLVKACADRGVHLAIGVNEREDQRPGTLYNSLLLLGPDGLLHRHRKLMATMHERVFHGPGAGNDLDVTELPGIGRVGGLLCWENWMPLARWRVYQGGPQIWLAPTADDSERWLISMRHIAIEAGAFVVSVAAVHPALRVPGRLPARAPAGGRGVRPRRRLHRLAHRRRHRRPALRRGGHRLRGLRPARGAPRQAVLRRGGPLQPSRRARPGGVATMANPFQVTIDSAGPRALGAFWCEVLGYIEQPPPPGFDTWEEALDAFGVDRSDPDRAFAIVDPEGRARACSSSRSPRARRSRTASTST